MRSRGLDLHEFESWLRSWGAADTTVTARLSVLTNLARDVDLAEVTTDQLGQWLGNPTFSPWTRVTYFSHVRSFFEWLRRTGVRLDDPTDELRRPQSPKRKPRPLTACEVSKILAVARGEDLTWFLLGLFAGLRAFEIAKLRGEDVTEDLIFVRGKGGKDAFLPTHPVIWQTAQTYPRIGYWFASDRAESGHVNPKMITNHMTKVFASVGVVGSTHRARHTYGTNLLRGGTNIRVVQELMRHESLATTAGYLGVDDDEKTQAIRRLSA